jgi:hypothetical protein
VRLLECRGAGSLGLPLAMADCARGAAVLLPLRGAVEPGGWDWRLRGAVEPGTGAGRLRARCLRGACALAACWPAGSLGGGGRRRPRWELGFRLAWDWEDRRRTPSAAWEAGQGVGTVLRCWAWAA